MALKGAEWEVDIAEQSICRYQRLEEFPGSTLGSKNAEGCEKRLGLAGGFRNDCPVKPVNCAQRYCNCRSAWKHKDLTSHTAIIQLDNQKIKLSFKKRLLGEEGDRTSHIYPKGRDEAEKREI